MTFREGNPLTLVPVSETMEVRVRLRFQSTPLHYAKKCCFLFDRDSCRTVGDLAFLVAARFGLEAAGIQLFLDDYLIPSNESSSIVRDDDLIDVRTMEGHDGDDSERPNDSSPSTSPLVVPKAKRQRKDSKQNQLALPAKTKTDKTTHRKKGNFETSKKVSVKKSNTDHVLKTATEKTAVLKTATEKTAVLNAATEKTAVLNADTEKSAVPKTATEKTAVPKTATEKTAVLKTASSKDDVLRVVKKKSATGGIHLTFRSSDSSSSDSSSSSTSSDSDTQTPGTGSRPNQKKDQPQTEGQPISTTPSSGVVSQPAPQNQNKVRRINFKSPESARDGSQQLQQQSSGGGRGVSRGSRERRGGRGRGRGRGRIVGGESDVLSVKSVVYRSPGEKERGSEWGVKAVGSSTQKESNSEKKSNDALGATLWEKSRVGFTQEGSEDTLPQEVQAKGAGEGATVAVGDDAVVREEVVARRDYSSYPALLGVPRVGDTIGFKILEISSSCTPEISDYKEAEVVGYNVSTSSVTVKYSTTECDGRSPKGSRKSALLRCNVLTTEEEEVTDESHDNHVIISLGSLLQPKLLS